MNRIWFFLILMVMVGCSRGRYHLYSPDKNQSITIITNGNIRYIVNGITNKIPEKNYVKIELKSIDRNVGDELAGCWNKDGYNWVIMMDNVKILENKLDTTKYLFKDRFPLNSSGIPTLIEYDRKKAGCFSLGFEYEKMRRLEGSISE